MQYRVVVVLGLAALCAVSCSNSKTGSQTATEASDSTAAMTPVQRGAYLVTVTGCHDCHTPGTLYGAPDMSRQLSGSELGWQGPWGVSYARNLTPDKTTGLGDWTDEEILNAMQKGVKKDGSPIAPPMPWPDFAHLTRADAMAIVAYLRSIPPIPHQMPPRVAPGGHGSGSIIVFPPPSEWDKPRG
jgi:mono/diheme cytochrome c family protein